MEAVHLVLCAVIGASLGLARFDVGGFIVILGTIVGSAITINFLQDSLSIGSLLLLVAYIVVTTISYMGAAAVVVLKGE